MPSSKETHPLRSLGAGAIAGAASSCVTYPLEYVKTQMQLESNKGKYTNPIQCALHITQTRGPLALYRGLPALVIGTASKGAVRFAVFEWVRWALGHDEEKRSGGWKNGVAGTATGVAEAILVVTPTEAIKTRLINDQNASAPRYRGALHGTATIFKEEGFGGIYRGTTAVIARQAANQTVRFTIYGILKDISERRYRHEVPWWVWFLNGAIANTVTTYATNPLDIVKTRMQAQSTTTKEGIIHILKVIVEKEGVRALWRGVTPRLGRMVIAGGVIFSVYEESMKMLEKITS